jgi:hypothetical protein
VDVITSPLFELRLFLISGSGSFFLKMSISANAILEKMGCYGSIKNVRLSRKKARLEL